MPTLNFHLHAADRDHSHRSSPRSFLKGTQCCVQMMGAMSEATMLAERFMSASSVLHSIVKAAPACSLCRTVLAGSGDSLRKIIDRRKHKSGKLHFRGSTAFRLRPYKQCVIRVHVLMHTIVGCAQTTGGLSFQKTRFALAHTGNQDLHSRAVQRRQISEVSTWTSNMSSLPLGAASKSCSTVCRRAFAPTEGLIHFTEVQHKLATALVS